MSSEHSHPHNPASATGQPAQAGPVAETSVRLAVPNEAEGIAEVQVAAWRRSYRGLLPNELLDQLEPEQFAAQWRQSLLSPGEARNRVLVALAGRHLVGFAALTPSDDPDADPGKDALVAEFCIHPDATRLGHGSRLLHAIVDTIQADRFERVTYWVNAKDDITRAFFTDAGWAPDGAFREMGENAETPVRIKQIRLHTAPTPTT
ncbi:GNAT family N-acetyltransferase [Kribbella deserti]|uniref:GNAT family N-acetyltransferase n=1 Tax=Kribbella deserti TaxID=1926257 RepID=A0ABV6QKB3_9ACTN